MAPIREAVLESGIPLAHIAYRLGWTRKANKSRAQIKPRGDTARLKRALGLQPNRKKLKSGRQYSKKMVNINYDIALRIADACGLDPVDVGL